MKLLITTVVFLAHCCILIAQETSPEAEDRHRAERAQPGTLPRPVGRRVPLGGHAEEAGHRIHEGMIEPGDDATIGATIPEEPLCADIGLPRGRPADGVDGLCRLADRLGRGGAGEGEDVRETESAGDGASPASMNAGHISSLEKQGSGR